MKKRALFGTGDRRLAVIWERADVGIAEVDRNGKLVRVNDHLARLLGYPADELLGRSIFDPLLTENPEADQAQFRRQVLGEIDHYTTEKRMKRRDGANLWTAVGSTSVRDRRGRFLYAVRVHHDITARRTAEEALALRADQQAALYEFTDVLQRATVLEDVYEPAVAAIARAFGCERVCLLWLGDTGTLQVVALRGLSESLRRVLEVDAAWLARKMGAGPVCISDTAVAGLPEGLNDAVGRENIRALSLIPIAADRRWVGVFVTCYDRPQALAKLDINLALTIARQLGFAIDRMRAEAARRAAAFAAQHLVAIVESSHDAIVSKDLNGAIRTWNRGAERLFGYKAQEVIGLPITIVIPPDRLGEEPAILARIRRGELVDHFETVRRRKDGSLVDISLTISPVRDDHGSIIGASKIARDITDRKQAEAKLQESERRLKDLLSAIPAAIYTTDAEGKVTYCNETAAELAGRRPTLGSDEWCVTWKMFRPDGSPLPYDQSPMAVALKDGRPIRNAEAIAERPDGSRVPFIPYPTPLRDTDGNIVGAINMLVDISERKQAETQQRILFNELNHRVRNNMQMLLSLLNLTRKKAQSAEARQVLGEAINRLVSMTAAQQILYQMTDASRFRAQEFLNAVCDAVRQSFSPDPKIICEGADVDLPNDTAMPLALIVTELLTNAVKHGAGRNGNEAVRIGLTRQGDACSLYVEDHGPGFDLSVVRPRSSGLQLVEGLARQLRGRFEVMTGDTTRCTVQFYSADARANS